MVISEIVQLVCGCSDGSAKLWSYTFKTDR